MIRKPEGENDVRVVFFSQDETRKLDIYVVDPEGKHHTTHDHSHGGVDNGTSVISLKDVSSNFYLVFCLLVLRKIRNLSILCKNPLTKIIITRKY